MRRVGPHRPIYGFGHSLGGAISALVELNRPGTFRGLFLFEPVVATPQFFDRPYVHDTSAGHDTSTSGEWAGIPSRSMHWRDESRRTRPSVW